MSKKDPNIVVREIRGEKKVGFRGLKYVERDEKELRKLVEQKKESIISLHEADNRDSPQREWLFGKVVEQTAEGEDNSELKEILDYSTLNISQSYDLKLFRNFYNKFTDGDFSEELPWALYREMLVDKRLGEFHDVYRRIIKDIPDDESVRTYEYRAYLNADNCSTAAILESLYNLGERHTSGLTPQKASEGARHIRTMAGEDPEVVSEQKVSEIIQKQGLSEE
jgi:hypothetical protein